MIDYKDLQIGNYVKIYNGEIYQVESIYYDCIDIVNSDNSIEKIMCDRIYPIEITEEILNKIGFHIHTFTTGIKTTWFMLNSNEFNIKIDNYSTCKDKKWSCQIDDDEELLGSFDFNYLHELQNGIRLITKENLTINEL